ncbi:MAG TPA: TadE/TadG family type IV pilus assembly protein [Candidatus Cybelea sp.]|nr:TadE/TadG family type IV pilus assembly protein [Candidatus Cybelea sp.]
MKRIAQFLTSNPVAASLRCRRGGTALEFAMVGPLFLLLLLTVVELGYLLFVQSVLSGASREAARMIRTGQVQSAPDPMTAFQNQLCLTVNLILPCKKVVYEAFVFNSFGSVALPPPKRDGAGNLQSNGFTPGGAGQIVAVRVQYPYTFIVPMVGQYLSPGGLGSMLVSSTIVFRNEPFGS